MTTEARPSIDLPTEVLREMAADHLWRHFTPMSLDATVPLKVMVEGQGCYLVDSDGHRYLDGLSALFCVNIGYSYGTEVGQAVAEQYERLPYANTWGTTYPNAILLASKVASLAPANLNHVYFTPSGGEAVEAAWKLARQYHRTRGENRWKMISRDVAYHGTTLGAMALLGINEMRTGFEPVTPGGVRVRNTNPHAFPTATSDDDVTQALLDDLEQRILQEDPSTVAGFIIEPVQVHGGCLVPPPGYAEGVRRICDKYGILLICDETITAWGRLGEWFASTRYGLEPDIITTAKGITSGYGVLGCLIASDEIYQTLFAHEGAFLHGMTYGGHPASTTAALKNIEILEREGLLDHVRHNESALATALASLLDLDVVAVVRGAGFLWTVELATTRRDGTALTVAELTDLYGNSKLTFPLQRAGLLIRYTIEAGDPALSIAPPLVAGPDEFHEIVRALRTVLTPLGADLP